MENDKDFIPIIDLLDLLEKMKYLLEQYRRNITAYQPNPEMLSLYEMDLIDRSDEILTEYDKLLNKLKEKTYE